MARALEEWGHPQKKKRHNQGLALRNPGHMALKELFVGRTQFRGTGEKNAV